MASLSLILISTVWVASSSGILLIWMFLEINSMGFILILSSKEENEGAIIYFVTQAIASTLILAQISIEKILLGGGGWSVFSAGETLGAMSMAINIGISPLHHWVVSTSTFLGWGNLFILLTAQKAPPLMILAQMSSNKILMLTAIWSAIVGVFAQISTSNINIILVFSSISHSGWIIALATVSGVSTTWYLSIYSSVSAALLYTCHNAGVSSLSNQENSESNPAIAIHLISLSGIPPFVGFLMNWTLVSSLHALSSLAAIIALIAGLTTVSTYAYLRMLTNASLKASNNIILNNWRSSLPIALIAQIAPTVPMLALGKP